MKGLVKRLLRENLLDEASNEDKMNVYFNMVNNELSGYIKKLNNLYDSFNDYTVMSIINMENNDIKTLQDKFYNDTQMISNMMSDYNKKMDDTDYDDYRDKKNLIIKMENSYISKENMLREVINLLETVSDVKDGFDKHPFDDIEPFNIG
jgi:hypothetical protein